MVGLGFKSFCALPPRLVLLSPWLIGLRNTGMPLRGASDDDEAVDVLELELLRDVPLAPNRATAVTDCSLDPLKLERAVRADDRSRNEDCELLDFFRCSRGRRDLFPLPVSLRVLISNCSPRPGFDSKESDTSLATSSVSSLCAWKSVSSETSVMSLGIGTVGSGGTASCADRSFVSSLVRVVALGSDRFGKLTAFAFPANSVSIGMKMMLYS